MSRSLIVQGKDLLRVFPCVRRVHSCPFQTWNIPALPLSYHLLDVSCHLVPTSCSLVVEAEDSGKGCPVFGGCTSSPFRSLPIFHPVRRHLGPPGPRGQLSVHECHRWGFDFLSVLLGTRLCVLLVFLDVQHRCCRAPVAHACKSGLGILFRLSLVNDAFVSIGHPVIGHALSPSLELTAVFLTRK